MPAPKSRRRETGLNTLSSQLRDSVAGRRLSSSALGRLAGVDRRTISRWLKGEADINLGTADRLASALGLRLAETPGRKSARPAPAPDPRSVFDVIRDHPSPDPDTSDPQ